MIRRFFIALAALAALLAPAVLQAQQAVGSWIHYPLYSGVPSKIVVTPSLTYYLINTRLYSYNHSTQEFRDYTPDLSSPGVALIDYDRERHVLFVAYTDGNIDLIRANGDIINFPDIADATLDVQKAIYDVEFWDNNMAVATSFGLVVFDTESNNVVQSGVYNKAVTAVALAGDRLVIAVDGKLKTIAKDGLVNRLDNFKDAADIAVGKMRRLNRTSGTFLLVNPTAGYVATIDASGRLSLDKTYTALKNAPDIIPGNTGLWAVASSAFHMVDWSGNLSSNSIPAAINNHAYGIWNGLSDIWAGNDDGIGRYDISSGSVTVKADKMKPAGATTVDKIVYIQPSNDGKSIYFTNAGSMTRKSGAASGATAPQRTDRLRDGKIKSVVATSTKLTNTGHLAEDPDDPDRYYIVAHRKGYYVVKNGEVEGFYGPANAPVDNNPSLNGLVIDYDGNLWITPYNYTSKVNAVAMLPAAKRRAAISSVTKSDWKTYPYNNVANNFDQLALACRQSPVMVFTASQPFTGIMVQDTQTGKGYRWSEGFTDQDGKTVSPTYVYSICEDKQGRVWVAHNNGIFEITNPREAATGQTTVRSLKVPRNDGTSFADYLLESVSVFGLSVDGSNRKWAATDAGLYLISPEGDEIIEHFTVDNSPLLTNVVNDVYADPATNIVYIGTNYGLMSYASDSAPASDDYSEVYAYPNPVRPDFSGWITVKGLMDDSLVKIADASGNVVCSGRSNGGMFTWDGCNASGHRVKSGVYYVFASQNSGNGPSGAVTKILVVN